MQKPQTVIFIGPQGSGKGTQAKILAKKIGAEYIEMGALLRQVAAEDTEFGRQVKQTIDSGILVDNSTWEKVIRTKLDTLDAATPAIFDGSPRNIGQAELLVKHLQALGRDDIATIAINLPREESIRRLQLRRVCENCKTPAIANGDPNQVCAVCGGKLIRRADETDETINRRLDTYEKDTLPALEYMRKFSTVHEIDGRPGVAEVTAQIDAALGI